MNHRKPQPNVSQQQSATPWFQVLINVTEECHE